ncbi:hypothetical protein [Spirochaeta dissipatitropha]
MSPDSFSLINIQIAIVIGFAGTTVIHLSKGVMRLGIQKLKDSHKGGTAVYILGICMNFTNPLWVIAANRFAPTVYYTSVYGLGLIPLLLFSYLVIGERPGRWQIYGSILIVVGTLIIGYTALVSISPSLYAANKTRALAVSIAWLLFSLIGTVASKHRAVHLQELFFGIAAGGLAALEAILKGIAQSGLHENSYLPQNSLNWIIFILSFFGAAGAFVLIQWSFHRTCRASVMGSVYNACYILLPLLIVPYLLEQFHLSPSRIAGGLIIIAGSLLISRRIPSKKEHSN